MFQATLLQLLLYFLQNFLHHQSHLDLHLLMLQATLLHFLQDFLHHQPHLVLSLLMLQTTLLLLLYFLQNYLHHQLHLAPQLPTLRATLFFLYLPQKILHYRRYQALQANFLRNHYSLLPFLPLQKPYLFLLLLIHQFLLPEYPFLNLLLDFQCHPFQDPMALHPIHYPTPLIQETCHPNLIQQANLKSLLRFDHQLTALYLHVPPKDLSDCPDQIV